ncbi:MAG: membrane protein insertase YidC [Ignavibacteriae bacterium]|nr:membrane protein insertase YidC [Ignavibacteriota bacterium]
MQNQPLDKRSIIGFVLISLILTGWLLWMSTNERKVNPTETKTEVSKKAPSSAQEAKKKSAATLSSTSTGGQKEDFIRIETDLLKIMISTKGGSIARWEMKNYKSWHNKTNPGFPVQLIYRGQREATISYVNNDGKKVDSKSMHFAFTNAERSYTLKGNESITITAVHELAPGSAIVKTFTISGNSYACTAEVELQNMEQFMPQRTYDITWKGGLKFQEQNSVDESNTAIALTSVNGTIDEFDATEYAQPTSVQSAGEIDFIATRTKYFVAAIIPQKKDPNAIAFMEGVKEGSPNEGNLEKYSLAYRNRYKGGVQKDAFTIFIGPQIYDTLRAYGLEKTINFGTFYGVKWLVAPIGEYVILPTLSFLHTFIANYGIVIILFSLLMKVVLQPFSASQMKSMQKMKAVQPLLQKVQEKYKDDRTMLSQETMKIYSEYGINPAGGCLPMIMQMPILISLWSVLSSWMDIRHQHFFGWISDLSAPDVILDLGFKLPLFQVDKLSGLALLMGIAMFIQQKMTVTDPNQKSMVYIMPIMFIFMFSGFPSGLNVYYFVFTVLGILQQVWITKFSKKKITLEDLKRAPKKEGWFAQRMRMAQELAQQQQAQAAGGGNKRKPIGNSLPKKKK